jgi:hypothetical protein
VSVMEVINTSNERLLVQLDIKQKVNRKIKTGPLFCSVNQSKYSPNKQLITFPVFISTFVKLYFLHLAIIGLSIAQ